MQRIFNDYKTVSYGIPTFHTESDLASENLVRSGFLASNWNIYDRKKK